MSKVDIIIVQNAHGGCMNDTKDILFELLTKECDLKDFIKVIKEKIFDNPVMITNSFFRVIAMSDDVFNDAVWNYAQKYHCCSKESIELFQADRASDRLFNDGEPFIYDTNLAYQIPRILSKIQFHHKTYGYLIVFSTHHPFQEQDIQNAKLVCSSLAVLLKNSTKQVTLDEYFIEELLKNESEHRLYLENEMYQFSWRFKKYFRVLNAALPSRKKDQEYIPYIVAAISQIDTDIYSLVFDKCIIVLCNYDKDEKLNEYLSSIKNIFKQYHICYGKSRSFKSIFQLAEYNKQAFLAREIGKRLGHEKVEYRFADYMYHFLLIGHQHNELSSLICKEYRVLKEYDQKNETEYINTLIVYFLSGVNNTFTSEKLHIHRNSLRHRLERIEDIIHISVLNIELLDQIYHSKMIDDWIQITSSQENL